MSDEWNARQAYDTLADDVREIRSTVNDIKTAQLLALQRRADAPRRWLFAIAGPVAVAVVVSLLTQTHLIGG